MNLDQIKQRAKLVTAVLENAPEYDVIGPDGKWHVCAYAGHEVVKTTKGVMLNVYFRPIILRPTDPTDVWGPFVYGHLTDRFGRQRVIKDERIKFRNRRAERLLEIKLARAEGMKYQTTPFLRLDGDVDKTDRKVYHK